MIHLSGDERAHLHLFVRRGKANARTLTRARILLKCDEGWRNDGIVEALDVSDQTIRNVRQHFRAGGVEAVLSGKQQEHWCIPDVDARAQMHDLYPLPKIKLE